MDNPLSLFEKTGDDSDTDEKYVDIQVMLEQPAYLNYTISSFLNERDTIDREIFEKRLRIYHGVDANFELEARGTIKHPSQFEGLKCKFMVNPLAGSEYIEYASKGYVGDGWFEKEEFLFRLHLSPESARNLIEKRDLDRKLAPLKSTYIDDYKGDDWLEIRLDMVNYRYLENFGHKVWFDIVRAYVY